MHFRRVALGLLASTGMIGGVPQLSAQTDYYNIDERRPVLIEDAYAVERYAFELQVAPVRLERASGGVYSWGLEPEIAWGALPRTHIEIGFPLHIADSRDADKAYGLAGIEISALHNLNVETTGLPALGVALETVLPVGSLGPDRVYPAVKGIATRTYSFARFHVNARYTFGNEPAAIGDGVTPEATGDLSRWLAGFAVDKTYPLEAALLIASLYAHQPLAAGSDIVWNAEAGIRYQLDPRFALDFGAGKQLTGAERPLFLTFGAAYTFAIRALMPREVAR